MFDDLLCAEVIGSMCRSNQARKITWYYNIITTFKVYELPNNAKMRKDSEQMFWQADQIDFM